MEIEMKRAVFSDFDGTLSDGYIAMEFLEFLHIKNLYSNNCYHTQMQLIEDFKNNQITYGDWICRWAEVWADGMKDQKADIIEKNAKEFYATFRKNIYKSSFDVMDEFGKKGFHKVIVSVGSYEVIVLAAAELGADYVFATRCEMIDGIYTGRLASDLHLMTGKADCIKRYAIDNDISLENSAAMGDSIHDASMLELVGFPVALNPSEELMSLAKKKGYAIRTYSNILEEIKKM